MPLQNFYTLGNFLLLIIFGRKQKGFTDEELQDVPYYKIFSLSVLGARGSAVG
jgi:hypothetical protein